ncbi:filamentous hemagglutinin N-terminal domain-containing protein [Nostocaceae cyanobacterium CENA357]|uniref:Filamentous hemagglutinin N-terminal domain-containing protein n=1 Tax=Atlanticothrix silvestris CENA357 TaxID=1725252 RepID=A0A8J7L0V7_9CYAN|nr:filamentous hemagglutinin N-terminal domain-containing protein [Atlanticothrix silvestris]MBH8553355.1 filamentous hemagglutinin N-terminal domain-containing protein [Atlanticothrix silvestris CENA357]
MTQSGKGCSLQLGLANSLATAGALALSITSPCASSAFAQSVITPDQNLGTENSQVINNYLGNPTEALTGGATRGNNLFHSFQEFNVKEGRSAIFLSPDSNIQNILVRVTGSNRSEILGKLETSVGSNANLFLINPNGVIFGQKATLQIGGSFVASTASGIKFADDTVFSATTPQTTPLLTVSVPLGLQFAKIGGEINLQGTLEVPTGKTLGLVGGNVTLDGGNISPDLMRNNLLAPNGQIALGGILGAGIIGLNLDNSNQILSFPNDVALADVSFINQARIDVSGDGGGYIQLQGKRITLNDASQIFADTIGSQNGRGISIQAEQLTLQNGSQIKAFVRENATGSGGSVIVSAADSVLVSGEIPKGKFNAGNPSALFTETSGEGSAGKLTITTGRLIVENGANVTASARARSQGEGGNLEVTASEFVKLSGSSAFNRPNGLFAQTEGSGNAGYLNITTPVLIVRDGSVISAATLANSSGNGGSLTIKASDYVELSGNAPNGFPSGLYVRSRGSGDGGSLFLTTGQLIVDKAQVTVSALQGGNAGNLEVKARDIRLNEGKLIAETTSGNGGDIKLQLQNLLMLRNHSQISTTAGISGQGGNGGNITIDTPNGFIVAVPSENSDISANAFTGKGGNVQVNAFSVFGTQFREKPTEFSDITASSEFGLNGTVEINTPDVDLNPELINLPTQPVEPQVSQVCRASTALKKNSFTITGRGGLPSSPTEPLNADAVLADWISLDTVATKPSSVNLSKNTASSTQTSIVEATGWVINTKGEVVLTANTPTATPHSSWQNSTDCSMSQSPS